MLIAVQYEEASSYSVFIFVVSLFGCHPALDARGCRSVCPTLCTPLIVETLLHTERKITTDCITGKCYKMQHVVSNEAGGTVNQKFTSIRKV